MKKIGIRWKAEHTQDQSGKIAVVTGSNTGIGYHMALTLADKGAHVILACRNEEKAESAKSKMLKTSPNANITVQILDLADLASIELFANQMKKSHNHLDILINNAGVMIPPKSITKDGFELQIGTNHFGHFALTSQLMPLLAAAKAPRIVTLSSIAHWSGQIDFEDINGVNKKYNKWGMYSQSKLANLLFALELDRRLKAAGSHIESLGSHPGYSATELQRHSIAWRILNPLFGIAPVKGAAPTLYAATEQDALKHRYWGPVGSMEARGWTGKANITERAAGEDVARRLWELTEKVTGIQFEI